MLSLPERDNNFRMTARYESLLMNEWSQFSYVQTELVSETGENIVNTTFA